MEKTIFIDDKKLKQIVRGALTSLMEKRGDFASYEPITIGTLVRLENKEMFLERAKEVWEILFISYESIGGIKTYRGFKDFIKKRPLVEIIVNSNNNILACATYRKVMGSLKMVAIGCDQSPDGKLALQQIIQHNIKNADLHYWAEVSGAIEYYFKKHNGFPMPNTLASEILQVPESDIVKSQTDNVHYERAVGEQGEMYTKMIFGIKSEDIFLKAIQEVENYSKFMEEVNKLTESQQRYSVKQAIYIIENIYRAHEEDGFNELIPSWHQALLSSLNTLQNCDYKDENINDYIGYAEYLLSDMQVLELHVLAIAK